MILPALSAGLTSDSPSMTLGRPPVSTGMADCHGPADRRHRRARHRCLSPSPARLFNDLAVWQDDNDRPALFEAKADS
jgi:hypothetical protein